MLSRDELLSICRLRKTKPWQEEKRYAQILALNAIASESVVMNGGTYLWLFHGLNRFSEDLDFTAKEELSEDIGQRIVDSMGLYGVSAERGMIKDDRLSLSFRLQIRGPLYVTERTTCYLWIEISKREMTRLPDILTEVDEPKYGIPPFYLRGMNLDECVAEKIRAIMTRNAPRDLYDLWYLTKKQGRSARQELINAKLSFYRLKYSRDSLIEEMQKYGVSWSRALKPMIFGPLPEFEHVVSDIASALTPNYAVFRE